MKSLIGIFVCLLVSNNSAYADSDFDRERVISVLSKCFAQMTILKMSGEVIDEFVAGGSYGAEAAELVDVIGKAEVKVGDIYGLPLAYLEARNREAYDREVRIFNDSNTVEEYLNSISVYIDTCGDIVDPVLAMND